MLQALPEELLRIAMTLESVWSRIGFLPDEAKL
jgi:hypothetical protein